MSDTLRYGKDPRRRDDGRTKEGEAHLYDEDGEEETFSGGGVVSFQISKLCYGFKKFISLFLTDNIRMGRRRRRTWLANDSASIRVVFRITFVRGADELLTFTSVYGNRTQ